MNNATTILRKEHQMILGVLDSLEATAQQLEVGEPVAAGRLAELLDSVGEFVERRHIGKEETLLFPLLEKKGLPHSGAPIGTILAEHQQERWLRKNLEEATAAYKGGAAEAAHRWAETASSYAAAARLHLDFENTVLGMAENLLSDAEQDELAAAFEKIEEKQAPSEGICTSVWIG